MSCLQAKQKHGLQQPRLSCEASSVPPSPLVDKGRSSRLVLCKLNTAGAAAALQTRRGDCRTVLGAVLLAD